MRRNATDLKASAAAIALIKEFESLRLEAYLCPAGKWTIGYGHTRTAKPGQKISEFQADCLLGKDVFDAEMAVRTKVTAPLTQNEYDGLVSFVFNIRRDRWNEQQCTLLRKLNAGDYEGAAAEFKRWVNAKDPQTGETVRLAGLVRRRAAEEALFRGQTK
jgi:lysozyme